MKTTIAGLEIAYDQSGVREHPALVLVHGSWVDRHQWDGVAPLLAPSFRVIAYDRRGHGQSERPSGQGSIHQDVDDLAAIVEQIAGAPAHLAANSYGAIVALRLAARRPELVESLCVHEPPAVAVIAGDAAAQAFLPELQQRMGAVIALLERGENAAGAQAFVDTVALGPGSWEALPAQARESFIFNAPTWLDETRDSEALTLDMDRLRSFRKPVLLTGGDQSPPFYALVLDKIASALPHAQRKVFRETNHLPHVTCPEEYVKTIRAFAGAGGNPDKA
jgi:pimeloyl-ACP methyl ester carboxylesterase